MPPKKTTGATAKAGAKAPAKPAAKTGAAKGATGGAAKSEPKKEAKPAVVKTVLVPEQIGLKEISAVLAYGGDVGEKLKKSNRWPYVIDRNGNVGTFLKYRNVNYLCTALTEDFNTEQLRKALLGSLCFGKPMVLDISEADQAKILDVIKCKYDEIFSGLYDAIMDRSILKEEVCEKLYVGAVDPDDYQHVYNYRLSDFQFLILTNLDPPSTANEDFFPIIVE